MRRRDLIAQVAGAVTLPPLAAHAQQKPMPVIGVLIPGKPDPELVLRLFRQGLHDLGYIDGQNIRIDIRREGAKGLPELAADLVRDKVDLIAVWQTPAALAAKQATGEVPIVMLGVADPIKIGLVASLARPGGNVTGTTGQVRELGEKNLELLRELLPGARRVAALTLAGSPFSVEFLKGSEAAGQRLAIAVDPEPTSAEALDAAFANIVRKRADAAVIAPNLPMEAAAELALHYRVPAAAPWRPFAEAGGLLAYTFNGQVMFRQGAVFVDKLLRGAKPADLPVEQPAKFEFVINQKTAKRLGLTIPPVLLARADEVIE
jgi:putative ABC transport system substrate-binding protein